MAKLDLGVVGPSVLNVICHAGENTGKKKKKLLSSVASENPMVLEQGTSSVAQSVRL